MAIVWLGVHRADRAKHAVRLVQGNTLRRYITNVRGHPWPRESTLAGGISRWRSRVKQHLKLRLLWSAKLVILQQHMGDAHNLAGPSVVEA